MPVIRTARRRRTHAGVAVVAVVCAAVLACSHPTAVEIGGVEAVARAGEVELTNRTDRPVFTLVLGRDLAARALWAPCVDATRCPPIPPGSRRSTPNPEDEQEAIIYWWHAVVGPDGALRPDSIRSHVIRLEN